MAVDVGVFESLSSSLFTTFTIRNPLDTSKLLRIAVLDSPILPAGSPGFAVMMVPDGREADWIFSTEQGHLQLIIGLPAISRLILVGHAPIVDQSAITYRRPSTSGKNSTYGSELQQILMPLLMALCPLSLRSNGFDNVSFVSYEDNVISCVVRENCVGSEVGELLVEDVEIENADDRICPNREFRRRLRFKRVPYLIQTQIRIIPVKNCYSMEIEKIEFKPDLEVLVHPYLAPMVAGLFLIGEYVEEKMKSQTRPIALCIGVGGGALLGFLRTQLGFDVFGVEADAEVLRIGMKYFGLEDDESTRFWIGDGIEFLEKISRSVYNLENGSDIKFDAIMVDLDSSDIQDGAIAPPAKFVDKHVLLNTKRALCSSGILVVNVIPSRKSFYVALIDRFREVFDELYEIEVGNDENCVLIASPSQIRTVNGASENLFLEKLKLVIPRELIDSVRKI